MLNLFPSLLFLSLFAPLLIRLSLSAVLVRAAYHHARLGYVGKGMAAIEIPVAVLLFFGTYTQGVALVGLLVTLAGFALPGTRVLPRSTLFLMSVMYLTLLITGAGVFAFDLPL